MKLPRAVRGSSVPQLSDNERPASKPAYTTIVSGMAASSFRASGPAALLPYAS